MERKTLEANREARDYAVLVGLRSPVLGEDSADEESLMELSELVETAGGETAGQFSILMMQLMVCINSLMLMGIQ